MHLVIGSLLLIGLHILGTNSATIKRASGHDLSGINELRKQVGELAGVKMPELVWDKALAINAKLMPSDCDQLFNGSDFRVFPDAPDENAQKLLGLYYTFLLISEDAADAPNVDQKVKERATKFINSMKNDLETGDQMHLFAFELLNPTQNNVGCAKTKCTFRVPFFLADIMSQPGMPPEITINSNEVVFNSICLLGPSSTWSSVQQVASAMTKVEALKGGKISYELEGPRREKNEKQNHPGSQYAQPTTFAPAPMVKVESKEESSLATGYQYLLALSIALFVIFIQ